MSDALREGETLQEIIDELLSTPATWAVNSNMVGKRVRAALTVTEREAVKGKREAFVACYGWLVDKVDRDRSACPQDAEVEAKRRYPNA